MKKKKINTQRTHTRCQGFSHNPIQHSYSLWGKNYPHASPESGGGGLPGLCSWTTAERGWGHSGGAHQHAEAPDEGPWRGRCPIIRVTTCPGQNSPCSPCRAGGVGHGTPFPLRCREGVLHNVAEWAVCEIENITRTGRCVSLKPLQAQGLSMKR